MSLTGHNRRAVFADDRARRFAALAVAALVTLMVVCAPSAAQAETRTLKLYNTHTGERAEITFKRNGRYVQNGLRELNRFLRDHRRNEPTRMDPELFDLVWEVYKASGARQPIHVVSAYRSPATNEMLRRTRGGQARKSQHTLGRAMDFFVPGVSTRKLRELGFKLQGGGVGYYPKSATPFVHLDTGNVRAWPRMSRSELTRLFPDGRTLHLPPDGRRLPGYQQALAAYNTRKRSGQPATFGRSRGGGGGGSGGGNLLANLFGGDRGGSDDSDARSQNASRSSAPSRRQAQPETPATILAALPSRSMPRPGAAPRPEPRTAVAAAAPQAPDTPPVATALPGLRVALPRALIPGLGQGAGQPEEAETPAARPAPVRTPEPRSEPASGPAVLLAELTPPLPQARPSVLVAAAEPPADRRGADQIEASATTAAAAADDDATALLAAAQAGPASAAEATKLALAMPLPSPAPRTTASTERQISDVPATLVAYASPTRPAVEPMVPPADIAARPDVPTANVPDASPTGRGARVALPAPRPEQADERILTAMLDTGVRTTVKSARASVRDAAVAPQATVPVVPAAQIDPARFGPRTVSVASVTTSGRPTERPEFIKNATRAAPEAVYTAGFSKAPPPDPNRLSGNAVTFLAVARFGGVAGGDGQPLQLQIPATN